MTPPSLPPEVTRVSSIENATSNAVVFAEDDKTLAFAITSSAGAILARSGTDPRIIIVEDPKYAFAQCGKALEKPSAEPRIHPSATIDKTAQLSDNVRVGAGAIIESEVRIGENSTIGPGAKILQNTVIGSGVVVQAGAVLGSTGFGFVRNSKSGEYLLFPQQGVLIIEDDVEIGANTTIDRGALGETRIGRGTKIDNLVHIGHNCKIGKNVVIAAQVGISGSCFVEDGAILAGQVGISDHCHIGPGVILGGQAGVFRGATVEGPGQMFAGTPAEPLKNFLKSLARLRRLK